MGTRTDHPEDGERRSVDEVIDRLSGRFPDVDVARIREIVAEEYRAYDGCPVRDFVPVLVEKNAKKRVNALVVA